MRSETSTENGFCECGCGQKTKIATSTARWHGYVRGEPHRLIAGHRRWSPVQAVAGEATAHAWAAGIIDGEGCIHIRSQVQAILAVSVTQSGVEVPEMLTRLRDLYGGSITRAVYAGGNRRPSRTWSVAARKAEALLLSVLPYLVEKRDQADIALEFRKASKPIVTAEVTAHYAELLRAAKRK
jgi:hypothetical protein